MAIIIVSGFALANPTVDSPLPQPISKTTFLSPNNSLKSQGPSGNSNSEK